MKFEVEYIPHPLEIPSGSSIILTFFKLVGRALDYSVSKKKKGLNQSPFKTIIF